MYAAVVQARLAAIATEAIRLHPRSGHAEVSIVRLGLHPVRLQVHALGELLKTVAGKSRPPSLEAVTTALAQVRAAFKNRRKNIPAASNGRAAGLCVAKCLVLRHPADPDTLLVMRQPPSNAEAKRFAVPLDADSAPGTTAGVRRQWDSRFLFGTEATAAETNEASLPRAAPLGIRFYRHPEDTEWLRHRGLAQSVPAPAQLARGWAVVVPMDASADPDEAEDDVYFYNRWIPAIQPDPPGLWCQPTWVGKLDATGGRDTACPRR